MIVKHIPEYTVCQRILILGADHGIGTVVTHATQYEAGLYMSLHFREVSAQVGDRADGLRHNDEAISITALRKTLYILDKCRHQTRA